MKNYSKRLIDVIEYSREEAARLQNSYIGPEHLMLGIIREGEGEAMRVLRELHTDPMDIKRKIEQEIKNTFDSEDSVQHEIAISKTTERVLRMSMLESRLFKEDETDTEHLLLAILKEEFNVAAKVLNDAGITYRSAYNILVSGTGLNNMEEFDEISDGYTDDDEDDEDEGFSSRREASRPSSGTGAGAAQPKSPNDTPVLDNFGTDMTRAAAENRLDPIVGREKEIERLAQILSRRKKNNPVLIGEPGVGKSAIVEGLALRIIQRKVSRVLFDKRVISLDMASIVAGTKYRGQFEERIKAILNELSKNPNIILFIDEIHRFNKGQQDYLLPFVEDGTIILIGATTENPYFEVNPALLSRSVIFELKKLSTEDIRTLLLRAVNDTEKGMGSYHAQMDDDALEFLADMANGDARAALTAIELGILTTDRSEDGIIHITLDVASECIQKRVINYDKTGDNHYDTISAFIKSMRGSDPDAAVYYLARMLYAGEDVKFIARRIMILASEDIGNADPQALQVAVAAAQAVERLGMPEARIVLAQAVTYMASAPKSNSAINAIDKAMRVVQETKTPPVPVHLQDAHYKSAGKLGHGKGYKYAHDYKNHYVKQQYLPDGLTGEVFYEPSENGYEQQIRAYYKKIKENPEE